MENNNEQETKLEVKQKRKGHGPIYWLIVIVGVAFIVAASFNLGTKFGKIVEGNDSTKSTNSNEISNKDDNSNSISNIDSNLSSNTTNLLSDEEALKIGNDLYTNAKNYYSHKMNQTEGCGNELVNVDGEQLMDCTTLYNILSNYFAIDNQVSRGDSPKKNIFSSFINKNGKYYLNATGGGFNGSATTTLTISKKEENKITYSAKSVISTYNDQGQLVVDSTVTDDFIITKENNTWKVSYFVARGI